MATQPVFFGGQNAMKFYVHESVGDSYFRVVNCIVTGGGIVANRLQDAIFVLVQPGQPGVSQLQVHHASCIVLHFEWVYACAAARELVLENRWAGCLVQSSPPPNHSPVHQPPAHPCAPPDSHRATSYRLPPIDMITIQYDHPRPVSPTHATPAPMHHSLPYTYTTCPARGSNMSARHAPTYYAPNSSTATRPVQYHTPPSRYPNLGPVSSQTPPVGSGSVHLRLWEQLDARFGMDTRSVSQVTTRAIRPLILPRIEPLAASRVNSQAGPQAASAPASQVEPSPTLRSTTPTPNVESRAASPVNSGASLPTSQGASPATPRGQLHMLQPDAPVCPNQDIPVPSSSLKRKRDASDQRTQHPKKPLLLKIWCQGCGMSFSFSESEKAMEHKVDRYSLGGCRNSDPVIATELPQLLEPPAGPEHAERNANTPPVADGDERSWTPIGDQEVEYLMGCRAVQRVLRQAKLGDLE